MTTLADLTRQTSRLINRHAMGAATAAESVATQLTDTVGLAGYPDDNFNGGTIWITSGTQAGKSRVITDTIDSTDRVTFAALAGNIASGVTWEAADANFVTYADLRQAVNLALREIGKIASPDETTTTTADKLTYTLPSGVAHVSLVEVVTDLGLSTETKYTSTHWDERQGQLIFDKNFEPAGGLKLRIFYAKFHAEMSVDTDALDNQIDEEYLVYLAARQAMRLAYKRHGKAGSETIPEWLNEAIEESKRHVRRNMGQPRVRVRTS